MMLNINPRQCRENMFFRCTTNNKIYLCSHKSGGTKVQVIKDIRSGNFVWVELVYNQEQGNYVRGIDTMSHVKTISYPDSEIKDENDLLVALTDKLDLSDMVQKQFYRSLFNSETNIVESVERFIEPKFFSSEFKTIENKNWIGDLVTSLFESVFFNWIQSS